MYHFLYGGADISININFNIVVKCMKHDENKDLRSFSQIGKVDYSSKTLQCAKSAVIGIHLWGKIDFLTKYCGWHFQWNNSAGSSYNQFNDNNDSSRSTKKAKKEHQLTDKTKKSKKK